MISISRMNRALFCKPTYFEIFEAKNPFVRSVQKVDRANALEQWEALRQVFVECGAETCTMEPVPGLEDMVFAASQSFVGVDKDNEPFMVPSNMLLESRRPEVQYFVEWFTQNGFRITDLGLDENASLECGNDLLWNADYERVWAGFGHRSSFEGVQAFGRAMDQLGIKVSTLELVNPYFFHLDTCLTPLTADSVLVYPGALAPESMELLRSAVRTYEVNRDDAMQLVCNGVSVNGYFITPVLTPNLAKILQHEKLQPRVVDTSEFEKSGGSVCCLRAMLP